MNKHFETNVDSIFSKDAGFVYETFRNETNRVIWEFFFSEMNPRYESLRFGFANPKLKDS